MKVHPIGVPEAMSGWKANTEARAARRLGTSGGANLTPVLQILLKDSQQ